MTLGKCQSIDRQYYMFADNSSLLVVPPPYELRSPSDCGDRPGVKFGFTYVSIDMTAMVSLYVRWFESFLRQCSMLTSSRKVRLSRLKDFRPRTALMQIFYYYMP